ncbi:hypothetical protein B4U80_13325 [Leptotrombidium deliense]|uniref:BTB domain-containing protein n=1 Tax=Leptotrombidium deliense TaxID=299467 RepID=A0A443S8E1_9ACAR|nr:hypothetical protein B4U80_13325 [Leptotrombidium deliense]
MNKFANVSHQETYFLKTHHLLSSETYTDITIACKDGKTRGNRLILAIYSNFLDDIFKDTIAVSKNSSYCEADGGINMPDVFVKDMKCLLNILSNTSTTLELNSNCVTGVKNVANQLQIDLIFKKIADDVFKIYAIPQKIDDTMKKMPLIENETRVTGVRPSQVNDVDVRNVLRTSSSIDIMFFRT